MAVTFSKNQVLFFVFLTLFLLIFQRKTKQNKDIKIHTEWGHQTGSSTAKHIDRFCKKQRAGRKQAEGSSPGSLIRVSSPLESTVTQNTFLRTVPKITCKKTQFHTEYTFSNKLTSYLYIPSISPNIGHLFQYHVSGKMSTFPCYEFLQLFQSSLKSSDIPCSAISWLLPFYYLPIIAAVNMYLVYSFQSVCCLSI